MTAQADTEGCELLTVPEVITLTRVPEGTLAYWRSSGKGPAWFRVGGRRVVYERAVITEWLAKQKRQSQEEQAKQNRLAS